MQTSPRALLISPPRSYRVAAYVQAAHHLGCELMLASEGTHSLVSEVARGMHVDLSSSKAFGKLLEQTRDRGFQAVVATDDAVVELASRIARALGLRHNPPRSAAISRRKDLARLRLAEAGVPVPGFRCIHLSRPLSAQIADVSYPCVVKPIALSASRGVIRANDSRELLAACKRIRPLVAELPDPIERERLLVEDFMPGREVALEGLLSQGDLTVLALFDKPDPLDGPYFEETYYITPSRLEPDIQCRIRRRVAEACQAYGLREGPVHAELRVNQGDAGVLEVASRTIGGQCGHLLEFVTGQSLEQLVLAQAMGRMTALESGDAAAGVLMIPIPEAGILRRVEGVLAARRVRFVEDVEISIREGYELVPLPEGSNYLGFIFARAPSPELAEQALREAHAKLTIVTAPVWRVAPRIAEGRGDRP